MKKLKDEQKVKDWIKDNLSFILDVSDECFPSMIAAVVHAHYHANNLLCLFFATKLASFYATDLGKELAEIEAENGEAEGDEDRVIN